MRSMENLYLVDFIELTLKGTDAFETALTNLLKTTLADYMQKYVMLNVQKYVMYAEICNVKPGDWPAVYMQKYVM